MKANWNLQHSYQDLPQLFYKKIEPTVVKKPELALFNDALAEELGLNSNYFKTEEGVQVLSGNFIPKEASPIAQSYAGHQFGQFRLLGDGRAILLGEQITPDGRRFDLQYKGSGPTPFSRLGDGRAALAPMLREYIISEAMYHLNIPTTRSLAVVKTGEKIEREVHFPGAILMRVAKSHIRIGTFEYAAKRGSKEDVKALLDYTIQRHEPDALKAANPYHAFFEITALKQAHLVASWQHVGFIHGVLNTDNVTISGETIDYGPCAFMNVYNPKTVFSSIDRTGRYAYEEQPPITGWNLARLAEAILLFFSEDKNEAKQMAENVLQMYIYMYETLWLSGMRKKLGFSRALKEDKQLIERLLDLMKLYEADYTNTFIALTTGNLIGEVIFHTKEFIDWHKQWKQRLQKENRSDKEIYQLMRKSNPSMIPRNHLVEEALEKAVEENDYSLFNHLLKELEDPFAYNKNQKRLMKKPPTDKDYRTFCGT